MAPTDSVPLTLPTLISWAAQQYTDRVALEMGDFSATYAELDALRIAAAKPFLAAGIEKGDRVALWAPNSAEWILASIGLQTVGAVLVPLNTKLQGNEAADIINRSGSRLLLTVPALEKGGVLDMLAEESMPNVEQTILLEGDDERATSWQAFLQQGAEISDTAVAERADQVGPDDVVDMLFTSGTTGKPKGVLCTHQQNIRAFASWSDRVGLRSDDNYMIINPFFHSFGYKAGWIAAFICGSKVLPVASFDKDAIMQQIERDKVTMLPGAPSLYEMILSDPNRSNYDLSSLRLGVTGAAAVPVKLVKDMRDKLGFETVLTAYGLTESSGVVTVCRVDDDPETIANTSGCAIDGVEVKCADPNTGEEVARGREGEIWIRGYNVMKGYFGMPEATAETITEDGWLRTGDIGVMDERGYIKITDRLKDMYIMNGENVYPAEVENVLYSLDGVGGVAVIGVPKQPQGEVGMAFIVPAASAALSKEQVQAYCAEHLARYKNPYYVEFVEQLPLNASGKVVKPELKKLAAELLA